MTQIKVLELMDAIQQTQKTADDMWRVLREVLEEQRNAQQSVQPTLLTPRPETVATKQNILAALEAIKQSQSG